MGGAGVGSVLEVADLSVIGTTNVHVVGVAALPAPLRVNPMASCYASGWRLGELVAGKWSVPPRPRPGTAEEA